MDTEERGRKRLLAFEIRCYRRLLAVRWQDHRTNADIIRVTHAEETLVDTVMKRKLQLFGHVCRMPEDRLLKTLMLGMVEGSRQPGRPHDGGLIIIILEWCGQDVKGAALMIEDRDKCRRCVASPYGPNQPRNQYHGIKEKEEKIVVT